MNRKDFLKVCGGACAGLIGLSAFLQSCTTGQYVQSSIVNSQIQIPKTEFMHTVKEKTTFKKFVLVKPATMDFPIVIYRKSETEFTALLLKCTHQGAELSVSGDLISCPAHGSEFGNKGEVFQGPAEQSLKTYSVTSDNAYVYVQWV